MRAGRMAGLLRVWAVETHTGLAVVAANVALRRLLARAVRLAAGT